MKQVTTASRDSRRISRDTDCPLSSKTDRSVPADLEPYQQCVLPAFVYQPPVSIIRAESRTMKKSTDRCDKHNLATSNEKDTRWKAHQDPQDSNAFAVSLSTLAPTASSPDPETDEPQVCQQSSKPITKARVLQIQAKEAFCRLFQSAKRCLAVQQHLDRDQLIKAQSKRPSTLKPVISHPKKLRSPRLASVTGQDIWAEQIRSASPPPGRHSTYHPSGRPLRSARADDRVQCSLTVRGPMSQASRAVTSQFGRQRFSKISNQPRKSPAQDMLAALSTHRPASNSLPFHLKTDLGCASTRHPATKIQKPRMNIHQALAHLEPPTMPFVLDTQPAELKSRPLSTPSAGSFQRPLPAFATTQKHKLCDLAVMEVFFEPIKDNITLNLVSCPPSPSPYAGSSSLPSPPHSLSPSPAPPPLTSLQRASSSGSICKPRPTQRLGLAGLDLVTNPTANKNQSPWYNDLITSIDRAIEKSS